MAENYSIVAELSAVDAGYSRSIDMAIGRIDALVGKLDSVVSASSSAANSISSVGDSFSKVGRIGDKSLNNLYSKLGGTNKQAGLFSGTVGQIAKGFTFGNIATKAMGQITSSFDGAINRLDTLNQFPKMMKSWGYSANDASKSQDKLVKGIEGLPTKLNDIVSETQALVVSGLELGTATDVALAFNNALLANGAGADESKRAMHQYNKMLSSGKVDLMSWTTLVNTMGKSLNDVAVELLGAGANQSDLFNAMKDGVITMDQFNDKMIELNNSTGGFAEQALSGSEGIATSMANVRTAIANSLAGIISSFDKASKELGIGSLAENITKLKYPIIDLGKQVEKYVPSIVKGFTNLNKTDLTTILGTLIAVRRTANFGSTVLNLSNGFTKLGNSTAGVFDGLGGKLEVVSKSIGNIFKMSGSDVSAGFDNISKKLGSLSDIASGIGGPVLSRLSQLTKAFNISSNVVGRFGGIFANTIGSSAKIMLSTAGTMAQGITSIVSLAMNALGPTAILGLVVSGLGYINKAYGVEIDKLLNTIQKDLPNMIKKYGKIFTDSITNMIEQGIPLFAKITDVVASIIPNIAKVGWDILFALVAGMMNNMNVLITGFTNIIKSIGDVISTYSPALLTMGLEILESIMKGLVSDNGIGEFITNFIENLVSGFTNNKERLFDAGKGIILAIVEGASQLNESLLPFLENLVESIVGYLDENGESLFTAGLNILSNIMTGITDNLGLLMELGLSALTAFMNGLGNNSELIFNTMMYVMETIFSALNQNLEPLLEAGLTLLLGLVAGITNNIDRIVDMTVIIIESFIGFISDNLGDIIDAGLTLLLALVEGIVNNIPRLIGALAEVVASFINYITNNLGDILAVGTKMLFALLTGILSVSWEIAKGAGTIILELINGLVGGLSFIYDVGKNIVGELWAGFKDGWRGFKINISDSLTGIRNLFPFSQPKDSSSPLYNLNKNGIMEQVAKGVYAGESELDGALTSVLNNVRPRMEDLDANVSYAESLDNGVVTHQLGEMTDGSQPMNVNLSMGGQTYRTFVEDITNEQGAMQDLELSFG